MAMEKSVFHGEAMIRDFITAHYDLHPTAIEKLDLGSANCFKISCDGGEFFLKEFQSKFDMESIKREIQVCDILKSTIPTSVFVPNKQGEVVYQENGHVFHLQTYIAGTVFRQHSYQPSQLNQEAVMLARIHQGLKNQIVLPDGFPGIWFTSWKKERSIQKYKAICAQNEAKGHADSSAGQTIAACQRKIQLLNAYDEDVTKFMRLSKTNSHGDYNNLQIIFDERERISAVIDFSSAAYLPAVWEIIRSYTYSAEECLHGDCIDLESLCRYIDAYLTVGSLTLFDVVHMAEFYYYSLLRSTYGLNAKEADLVEFGLWRTRLCIYLSEHYKEIGEYMYKNYAGQLA